MNRIRGATGTLAFLALMLQPFSSAAAAPRQFDVVALNHPVMAHHNMVWSDRDMKSGEKSFSLSACTGEYEPVSALVHAHETVHDLIVTCSDLVAPQGTILASCVDVTIVKSWFQGNPASISYSAQKWLVPELLLKDDALVRVDMSGKSNYLRSTGVDGSQSYFLCSGPDSTTLAGVRPRDAADLQPVDMAADEIREYWITVHVPDGAASGTYKGTVLFRSATGAISVPILLIVHSFPLLPARLTYALYYRGTLSSGGASAIGSETKSEEQYHAEMQDMKAHGVLYPTNYQGHDPNALGRILQIRRDVGLPTDLFYNLGYIIGPQALGEASALKAEVHWWLHLLKPLGYDNVFFYGLDEARGQTLRRELPLLKACKEAGGRTFVACYHGAFEIAGNALDVAVLSGAPDSAEGKKWHSCGSQVFCYGNPQVGVEDPSVYRRNYGLVLMKAGFDGEMDYAYQHGFGHIWNDFDDLGVRDHVFAYPTVNGVVDTIAWEGFREGIDDVRYASTLEMMIANASESRKAVAAQARAWLERFRPDTADLDDARQQIVEWIVKIR